MYNKFFGLAEAPFNITPDSRFLFLSRRHREALGALVYGIRERKGFILLTGEIGSGKTTVCRALVQELRADNTRLAVILNPGLNEIELLKAVNDEFGIPSYYDTKKGLIDALNQFLIQQHQAGTNVVLIIDEAQNLDPALLEQIRMLSNLETEDAKLIQIVLMGQPELNDTLALSQLEQLNQRIAVRYHVGPLTEEEMQAYIRHRLFVARAKIDVELTPGAIRMAYATTRGIPRRINVLMDRALLASYVEGSYTLDERIMAKAVQEIAGELPQPPKKDRVEQAQGLFSRVFTMRTAIGAAALIATLALVVVAVDLGIRLANVKASRSPSPESIAAAAAAAAENADTSGTEVADSAGPSANAKKTTAPKAAAMPEKTLEQIRRENPNWKYEKNSPLVRVNNERTVFRACQLTLLKTWGIAVDLSEMSKLSEDTITQGEFKSEKVRIQTIPIKGDFEEATRLDVPLIVRLTTEDENDPEYVVLLQSQGLTSTVGDPLRGIKFYKTADLAKKWAGAQTLFVDVYQLSTLKKGDRNERVRAMQQFLKEFLTETAAATDLDAKNTRLEVNGLFDVSTTDAIRQFQAYYEIPETGQLDSLTLMLLNSRMMRNGPRLRSVEVN
jgi:general secretion pathway protein A